MDLHPDYPVVYGVYRLTDDWTATLPFEMNKRIEDGSLVLWRPGFTIWVVVWGNDNNQSAAERLEEIMGRADEAATDMTIELKSNPVRLAYRLEEEHERGPVKALYGFAFKPEGHVQLAVYLDQESDIEDAYSLHRSLR